LHTLCSLRDYGKLGMVAHTSNPSTRKAEAGGSPVQYSKALSQRDREIMVMTAVSSDLEKLPRLQVDETTFQHVTLACALLLRMDRPHKF
jgi:hypothetical protein